MGITIGDAILWIRGDRSKLSPDLNAAETQTKSWGSRLSGALKDQMNFAMGQIMASGLTQLSNSITNFMREAIDTTQKYNEEIADLSRLTGATLEDSSRLYNVADDLRVGYGDLSSALRIYATRLKDTGSQEQLSIETLAKLSDEYLKLPPGIARTNFLIERFGRNGAELAKILEKGSDELRRMGEGLDKNLIVTEESVAASEAYRLALDEWDDSIKGLKIAFAQELLPYLTEFLKFMTAEGIPALRSFIDWFKGLPEPVQKGSMALGGLFFVLMKIGPAVLGITGLLNMLSGGGTAGAAGGAAAGAAAKGGGLMGLVNIIRGAVIPVWNFLGTVFSSVAAALLSPIGLLVMAIGLLIFTWQNLGPAATKALEQLVFIFTHSGKNLAKNVKEIFRQTGQSIIFGIYEGIKQHAPWLFNIIDNLAGAMFNSSMNAIDAHSASKLFKKVGKSVVMGIDVGFSEEIPKLIASMQSNLTRLPVSLTNGIGAGMNVGHIEYHGSFSDEELNRLDRRSKKIARNTLLEAFG